MAPAPRVTSDESGGPRSVGGEGRARRGAAPGRGVGTWKSGILRTCEAAGAPQVFSFSGFQVFARSGPAPIGGSPSRRRCSDTAERRRGGDS